jgi:hypothetical protein
MLFVYCRTVGQTIGTVCRSKQTDEVIISILGRLLVPWPKIEYSSLVARTRIINQCKGRQFVSHPDEVQTNFPTPAAAFHYSNTSAPKFCTPYFVLLRPCLVPRKFCKIFQIPRHIESLDACMKH